MVDVTGDLNGLL